MPVAPPALVNLARSSSLSLCLLHTVSSYTRSLDWLCLTLDTGKGLIDSSESCPTIRRDHDITKKKEEAKNKQKTPQKLWITSDSCRSSTQVRMIRSRSGICSAFVHRTSYVSFFFSPFLFLLFAPWLYLIFQIIYLFIFNSDQSSSIKENRDYIFMKPSLNCSLYIFAKCLGLIVFLNALKLRALLRHDY